MGLYANILETLGDDCNLGGKSKNVLLAESGISEEDERTDTIYVGQNLPQFDVNRLVDRGSCADIRGHGFVNRVSGQCFQDSFVDNKLKKLLDKQVSEKDPVHRLTSQRRLAKGG